MTASPPKIASHSASVRRPIAWCGSLWSAGVAPRKVTIAAIGMPKTSGSAKEMKPSPAFGSPEFCMWTSTGRPVPNQMPPAMPARFPSWLVMTRLRAPRRASSAAMAWKVSVIEHGTDTMSVMPRER